MLNDNTGLVYVSKDAGGAVSVSDGSTDSVIITISAGSNPACLDVPR